MQSRIWNTTLFCSLVARFNKETDIKAIWEPTPHYHAFCIRYIILRRQIYIEKYRLIYYARTKNKARPKHSEFLQSPLWFLKFSSKVSLTLQVRRIAKRLKTRKTHWEFANWPFPIKKKQLRSWKESIML